MDSRKNKLIILASEAIEIEKIKAKERGALGFMARSFIQATMPHRNPGNIEAWGRENGSFSVVIQPGIIKRNGELVRIGLPYGSIPRLLLAWITSEAVRTKSPNLVLGSSLSSFMVRLGMMPTGGRWGTITRLREQMKRLFSAHIFFHYSKDFIDELKENQTSKLSYSSSFNITKSYQLWWNPKHPSQAALWNSEIVLNQDFFEEIINYPVPIDMRVLNAIKQSPMALDIYFWLNYRMSYLKKSTQISWELLKVQFGSSYAANPQGIRNFKKAFLRELEKVKLFYPKAKIEKGNYGVILEPSKSHIPKKYFNMISEEKLRKKYNEYCYNQLLNIVKNNLNPKEKKLFFNQFSEYLRRNKAGSIDINNIKNKSEKELLHRFISNFWHNLFEHLQSFEEFVVGLKVS